VARASNKMPFRVSLAILSLTGLGIAAMLPAASERLGLTPDPITTATVGKTDQSAPTLTDLPDPLGDTAEEDAEGWLLPGASRQETVAPRQILPTASPAVTQVGPEWDETSPASDVRPAVEPVGQTSLPLMDESMDEGELAMVAQPAMNSMAGDGVGGGAVILALDHARVMRVVGNISTIVIGNPAIADASMPDPHTLILTGKSYGETNLVMLDHTGAIVAEQMLRVTVRGQSLVSVYRGVQRTTLSCSPTCEIRPTPGDVPEQVQAGLNAFQARNEAALQAVAVD
jgi:hypothetical protein